MALDLQYVSPELLNVRNLDLAVPGKQSLYVSIVSDSAVGTYQSGREIVYIASFAPRLTVISSKQRPRRMALKGSDGRDYQYLLKGDVTVILFRTIVLNYFQAMRICVRTSG
jgi:FKBP12-rapamycin complex-associated protein